MTRPIEARLENLNRQADQLQRINVVLSHTLVTRLEEFRSRYVLEKVFFCKIQRAVNCRSCLDCSTARRSSGPHCRASFCRGKGTRRWDRWSRLNDEEKAESGASRDKWYNFLFCAHSVLYNPFRNLEISCVKLKCHSRQFWLEKWRCELNCGRDNVTAVTRWRSPKRNWLLLSILNYLRPLLPKYILLSSTFGGPVDVETLCTATGCSFSAGWQGSRTGWIRSFCA